MLTRVLLSDEQNLKYILVATVSGLNNSEELKTWVVIGCQGGGRL